MGPCLVLGGAGFIGSHLAEALAQEGHRVKVFDRPHVDRLPLFPRARGFEVFTGDFLNPQALAPALQGTELVFHLVSTTLPKSSNDNPVYDVESNVLGSLRDRKSTRLNSSHGYISYAVFCLKKKKTNNRS